MCTVCMPNKWTHNIEEKIVMAAYLGSVIVCLFGSTMSHTFCCYSKNAALALMRYYTHITNNAVTIRVFF
jgi:hypothetical protein